MRELIYPLFIAVGITLAIILTVVLAATSWNTFVLSNACENHGSINETKTLYDKFAGCYELIDNKWQKVDL